MPHTTALQGKRMTKKIDISRRDLLRSGAVAGVATGLGTGAAQAQNQSPVSWHREADVVVIGSGATGMPAAIVAREAGSSVIVVEAEADIGGHAICNGGHLPLGGGTSLQKKHGIEDSPDLVFADITDWSIVNSNGAPDYRYNDREVIRAYADNCAQTFEFLLAHGLLLQDKVPDGGAGASYGNSVFRMSRVVIGPWPAIQTGKPVPVENQATHGSGIGLMRPLEASARKIGVQFLLEHRMTSILRENGKSGRVMGIAVSHQGKTFNIRARKAVVIATGGSSGNVNFRRMFDPRLTEEYCGIAGMPWSDQDASGEIAAMEIGASLWGTANQTLESGAPITKAGHIGCQYGYQNLQWHPGSRVFDKARASGLAVEDFQNLILVNMIGKRFYNETAPRYGGNRARDIWPYTHGDWRNSRDAKYAPRDFINAALAGIGDGKNGGGPIWAIFDADAVAREKWDPRPPHVDVAEGFFFQADTLGELARRIQMKYQRVPMPPENLEATVARYNSFVDGGKDLDFEKPKPLYKIAKGPFYAAWATPTIHDTRCGLRINAKSQVVDMNGEVIPGLYCGGESAGGFSLHGMARALVQGYVAGREAHAEKIA